MGASKLISYSDFLPLPSSAYQLLMTNAKEENQLPVPFLNWEEITKEQAGQYMRLIGLVIAKRVCFNFLLNLYNDSEIILVKKTR